MSQTKRAQGFTLIELVAVLILVGILAASIGARLVSQSSFSLLASRDQLVSAFSSAQQLAMVRKQPVRFSTRGGQLDVLIDINNDGVFDDESSVRIDGVQYPILFQNAQTVSELDFDFNRLGRTSEGRISMIEGSSSIDVVVSAAGSIR